MRLPRSPAGCGERGRPRDPGGSVEAVAAQVRADDSLADLGGRRGARHQLVRLVLAVGRREADPHRRAGRDRDGGVARAVDVLVRVDGLAGRRRDEVAAEVVARHGRLERELAAHLDRRNGRRLRRVEPLDEGGLVDQVLAHDAQVVRRDAVLPLRRRAGAGGADGEDGGEDGEEGDDRAGVLLRTGNAHSVLLGQGCYSSSSNAVHHAQ